MAVDPITTALVNVGEDAAKQVASGFLSRIAGPAADEVGLMIQDKARLYRFKNQIKMLGKAQKMVESAGIDPGAVPMRTLLPLMEGASLEDDEDLNTKWAALLANASDGEGLTVLPSFPDILKQLSPHEAAILNTLPTDRPPAPRKMTVFELERVSERSGVPYEVMEPLVENLQRLGIVTGTQRLDSGKMVASHEGLDAIGLSHFGFLFLKACRAPAAKAAEPATAGRRGA